MANMGVDVEVIYKKEGSELVNTAGGGTAPPTNSFYFPTGLAVSKGGNVLYAINSDFDLQWNGGTLQSYDLFQIRQDTAALIQANLSGSNTPPPNIPFIDS